MLISKQLIFVLVIISTILGMAFIYVLPPQPQPTTKENDIYGDSVDLRNFFNKTNNEGLFPLKIFQKFTTTPHNFTAFNRSIMKTTVGKNGIPAISNPKYIPLRNVSADVMNDWDIVFGIIYRGRVIAYPQKILVWHEVLNTEFGSENVSITYCPLTGSTIAYKGKINSFETSLGASGKLLNNNLVMVDNSGSLWPQILGQAISGSAVNETLDRIQLYWSTWKQWSTQYPETLLLSTDTGYIRPYYLDPYGSYEPGYDSYYQSGGIYYSTMAQNHIIASKEIVYGIQNGDSYVAFHKPAMKEVKVLNYQVGDKQVVMVFDDALDTIRIFNRNLDGQTYTFDYVDGLIRDLETNTIWSTDGQSSLGTLSQEVYMDSFWFAWFAFFPTTELIYLT